MPCKEGRAACFRLTGAPRAKLLLFLFFVLPMGIGVGLHFCRRSVLEHCASWGTPLPCFALAYHGTDFLYALALFGTVWSTIGFHNKQHLRWIGICLAFCAAFEFSQRLGWGTFDWLDIVAYLVGLLAASLTVQLLQKLKPTSCPCPPPQRSTSRRVAPVFLAFGLIFVFCANQKEVVLRDVAPPSYSYSPPSTSPARSSGVVLALFNPVYSAGFQHRGLAVHEAFMKSFAQDFEEMLVARGFSMRGPYRNYDEITYSDKTETHLLFTPEVELVVDDSRCNKILDTKYVYPQGNVTTARCEGEITIRCQVTLTAKESLSKELLWKKVVPLSEETVTVSSEKSWGQESAYNSCYIWDRDPGITDPRNRGLERLYVSALATSWNLIDPKELDDLLPQIKTIREKKVH